MAMYQPQFMGQYPFQGVPQMAQQMPMMQQQSNTIKWVQGIAGAKAYLVAPGQTADLWDCEDKVIYLKTADMNGIPSMQIIDYTIRDQNGKPETIARKEFDLLAARVAKLEGGLNNAESAV